MRLGLPPFSLVGIPLRITGTKDNSVVNTGRKSEELNETEYQAEVRQPLYNETKPQ